MTVEDGRNDAEEWSCDTVGIGADRGAGFLSCSSTSHKKIEEESHEQIY
jgi:hypothetical protein